MRRRVGFAILYPFKCKDRQYSPVGDRIQKFVRVPRGSKRSRLGFAIADDTSRDQIRIVEDRSESMAERVAEFATFVNRAWTFGRDVAGDAAGKRELLEQLFQASLVLRDLGVDFAVRPFQVRVANDRWSTMSGTGDVDHVQIEFLNHAIQMHIDKILPGCRPPMAEQHWFDMRPLQWLA